MFKIRKRKKTNWIQPIQKRGKPNGYLMNLSLDFVPNQKIKN